MRIADHTAVRASVTGANRIDCVIGAIGISNITVGAIRILLLPLIGEGASPWAVMLNVAELPETRSRETG